MIRSVSTAQQTEGLRIQIARQRQENAKAGMELATGFKEDVFASRGSSASQSMEFRSRLVSNDAYKVANQTLATQFTVTSNALSDVRTLASDFMGILISGDIASTNRETLRSSAESALEAIVNKLNTSYNGSYLFSGTSTNQRPMVLGADNVATYQGGAGNLQSRIDDETILSHGIRADDPDIAAVMNVLSSIVNADMDAMNPQQFSDFREISATTLAGASERITGLQARLGDNEARLERMIVRQNDMSNIYSAAILDIEGVDPAEAAIRLEAATNQLQATFEVTARMSQMSFLNFIR